MAVGLQVLFEPLTTSTNYTVHGNGRQTLLPGLKGGAQIYPVDGDTPSLSTFITPETVSTVKSYAKAQADKVARSAPLTTLQIICGIGLHAVTLFGILPSANLLFHPRLIMPPHGQVYRIPSSFLVLGLTTYDVLQRAIGLAFWQAPFEQSMPTYQGSSRPWIPSSSSASTNETPSAKPYPAGTSKSSPASRPVMPEHSAGSMVKKSPAWASLLAYIQHINPKFLQTQLISAGIIVTIELLLAQNSHSRQVGNYLHLFPYTLYPTLEHSMRWLWAMTAHDRESIPIMGVVRLEPVMIPLVMCAMGGFSSITATVKGLLAAIVAAKILDIRRWNGEPAVDWFHAVALSWCEWISAQIETLRK
ncbi:hypothetical protein BATDEDRAFT_89933 [Batrachochytrium dendrobatidis JAM81]|uniref:Uncharacterized protein n=1 Tax=Batrachochytrium dendrobatidis (strain JAM81 / FGSC 10211) TaxID=684364 RepID=F4P676_BATDJ|nr:uncharacterized protein BATDEDRAFT_89933 [Batrachochytrium dendrobatidis JAM81]EGF79302.1 hypothetical protein BATDEDRAFT_89933 [Batrachochytrium dendrobatidis JAM81]KAJ8322982.1 hypothetical protein O5D80_008498 [Batrachochytrium dendrobatidis]KAK5665699.1 hypothetical protein QVD99_007343 [Batrachochytrium dendrobatidis]|eukprot:XP_006680092.1 hypothetical protein BATDEDRAFT_89933 [Batrachochytrium dendrobatidis JAM81]